MAAPGEAFALAGCTVALPFSFADLELARPTGSAAGTELLHLSLD